MKTKTKDKKGVEGVALRRNLLRYILALRLKEIDAIADLEVRLGYGGIPRLDIINQLTDEMAIRNDEELTDEEADQWLAKWTGTVAR